MTQDLPIHADIEGRMREILVGAGLPELDRVEQHDDEVHFLWEEQQVVVIIEARRSCRPWCSMIVADLPILEE